MGAWPYREDKGYAEVTSVGVQIIYAKNVFFCMFFRFCAQKYVNHPLSPPPSLKYPD